MMKPALSVILLSLLIAYVGAAQDKYEEDVFKTSEGDLRITFIGHGTLMLTLGDKVIHVDPVSSEGDYTTMPKADVILITHEHGDHLDPEAIQTLSTATTSHVMTETCAQKFPGAIVMSNGDIKTVSGFRIEAVPAYNIQHMRGPGQPYHPKGRGNGYVISLGDKRVYVAGDTENVPEMKNLEAIDIAFLPMNLPYTMTPEMVAEAAKAFRPKILYPYHYGDTDTAKLRELFEGEPGIEVRIRKMQ